MDRMNHSYRAKLDRDRAADPQRHRDQMPLAVRYTGLISSLNPKGARS